MSAVVRELIATVHSAGGSFRIVDGRVRVEAPAPLPCELMERLRALKGEVFGLLASGEPGHSALSEAATAEAIEERAALAADCVPACYLDAWAGLNHQKPVGVSEGEWRRALNDGGLFLDQWGSGTAELGWTAGDLFGVNRGLVWRLAGERVKAISADHARLSDWSIVPRVRTRGFG
jgi:hypothetical protein